MIYPEYTVIGALAKYISTENDKFQPMNANFGIMNNMLKDRLEMANRSLDSLKKWIEENL